MQALSKHPLLVVVGFPQWFCLEMSQLSKAKLAHTEFMCLLFHAAICAHLSHTHTLHLNESHKMDMDLPQLVLFRLPQVMFTTMICFQPPPHACCCMWSILVKLFSRKVWFSGFSLGHPTWENIPMKTLAPLTVCLCCSPIWNHFGIHVGVNLGTFWNTI